MLVRMTKTSWLVCSAAAVVVVVALVLALAGPSRAANCENPKALRFSLVPTQDSLRELSYYKPILDVLSKETGKKIEFYMPTSYSSVVEALLGKWVDLAVLGPESYVIVHDKDASVDVFATYYRKQDGVTPAGPGYKSVLITKKGSKFTTIASLKGAVLALVDPASTSGALMPEHVFAKEIKMPLKQYFSQVVFSGGHDLSAIAVDEGKADAAFVATHRLMETVHAGKVKQEDFNYLWYSPMIPQDPYVIRTALCKDLRDKIVTMFLHVDKTPEGRKYLDNVSSERIVKMTDADYNIIREVAK